MVNELAADVVLIQTLPKAVSAVADKDGVAPPQVNTALAALRGAGNAVVKSAALSLVSVQPLLFLKSANTTLGAGAAAVPSKHTTVVP